MLNKKTCLVVLLGGLMTAGFAQQRPTPIPSTPGSMPPTSPMGAARTSGPRPYKEIITDKAVSKKGLFTVHKVEDKFYFEIADSILNREIMAVTRFVKVPSNNGGGSGFPTYGGDEANTQTLSFEKGPSNNVFLRVITLVSSADSTNAIYQAVNNSNLNAIAAAFPIAAFGRDSSSVIIDVTEYFKGDNQLVSITPATKRSFNLSVLASDRSYIVSINTYPINTEIRTVKTYSSSPVPGLGGGSSSTPSANAAGAVTMELNTSMVLLPRVPMAVRHWDRRVGFFPDNYTVYTDDQQKVSEKMFAVRWRMEPKDEDMEKWKRGELVEPKKQIVYYIDPATPRKWRPFLIKGINDWQAAFEQAGFKNAIVGKEWPENNPAMSMEDARYSVLRYFASGVTNAFGPNIHDPRSGEIINSDIGWFHNVMKLVHDWYMVQAAAVNPRARKMKFDDDLMGELIRFVSSHEVGHTLGLLHNMGSSSKTPVEKLRDKAWVEANGHTASIMDYARFNYVAQPEDNVNELGLFPRIGDYDKWAIKWGYGYLPGTTEEELKKNSNKLIIETIKNNPRTWFGTYELGNQSDPRSQREDLGDDAVKASEYGIKNLKFILTNLSDWTKDETDLNENLSTMYGQVIGQFRLYLGHVTTNIGGVYETLKTSEQGEPVYDVTPKNLQKNALAFLQKQIFQTPQWLVNRNYSNRINNPGTGDLIASAQESALNNLISTARLNRMQVSTERYGATKAYSALELMNDLQAGLFSELNSKQPIDAYRRTLQKSYVEKLANILNPAPATGLVISFGGASSTGNISRSDIPSIARAGLMNLSNQVNAGIAGTTDQMSRIHLIDLKERIKQALDPKQ